MPLKIKYCPECGYNARRSDKSDNYVGYKCLECGIVFNAYLILPRVNNG